MPWVKSSSSGQPISGRESASMNAAARSDAGAVTDDAALVERAGVAVVVVEGSPEAFKVTTPLDLLLAEALVADRGARR